MATNDAAAVDAISPRGRIPQRRGGGPQPCTTAQTAAWSRPASTTPSADATVSIDGLASSDGTAAAPRPQLSGADVAVHDRGPGIGVFVLGEHELVRQGLVDLVSAAPDMLVVGAAGSAEDGLPRIAASAPAVVLVDTQLPNNGEVYLCRQVSARNPATRCILLTSFDDDESLFTAVMAGAAGYLVKQIGGGKLLDGIRTVAAGRSLLDAAVTERLLDRLRHAELDGREQQLLLLVSSGSTDAQIVQQLRRSEAEIRDEVTALRDKLALRRREPSIRSSEHGAP